MKTDERERTLYLITGATGHLGNTIIRELSCEPQVSVRALAMPNDPLIQELPAWVEVVEGDVCRPESLDAFFSEAKGAVLIHAAGIVSIASKASAMLEAVNVAGTKNVLDRALASGVGRAVYVSSVHAIPEKPKGEEMSEVYDFSADYVHGGYAKTKAEATRYALSLAERGFDISVVHPSGIAGPYDYGRGHITQLLIDYYKGKLTALIRGGYDFVDVRDVAKGIISCCQRGEAGECYILSNRFCSLEELVGIFNELTGRRGIRTVLPMWFAKMTAPLAEAYYKLLRQPPLFTNYSLYTLSGNAQFSHDKATHKLGYTTRPFEQTIEDAFIWLRGLGRI